DRDGTAREIAGEKLSKYGERVRIMPGNFSEMADLARDIQSLAGTRRIAGVLFDLGVSNMQLTTPERGFSYQDDGPLDMRMDADSDARTAADVIEGSDARELARIFREYGEERHAYRIARGVTDAKSRGETPTTTGQMSALIRRSLPAPVQRKMGGHPARRVFQALRIAVNSELESLQKGLIGAYRITSDKGAIVAISYHSLEDRIVKHTFRDWARDGKGMTRQVRPILPSEEEALANRKSRSAKLRAFVVSKANEA
ncbi:MAG: 16S rRNA (cytosine(1402)-N(4))-methyltransferase RsmH, partial [Synergistaceae bacterium]|nr:16S rRNA (cytosine(1402)-N(4))-methyltransferase RsmH [Synergistaceae bacterium]